MKTAIIGKKVGMTQIFDEAGKVVPVTVIEAGPCTVTGKMTTEKEGYEAVQLGYEDVAEKKLTKPEKGHLDKAGVGYKKHLKEFRLEDCASVNVGSTKAGINMDAVAEMGRTIKAAAERTADQTAGNQTKGGSSSTDRGGSLNIKVF